MIVLFIAMWSLIGISFFYWLSDLSGLSKLNKVKSLILFSIIGTPLAIVSIFLILKSKDKII